MATLQSDPSGGMTSTMPRLLTGRTGRIIANRLEQVLPLVVREAGMMAQDYAAMIGHQRNNTYAALMTLAERGLLRFTVHNELSMPYEARRYYHLWFPTTLGRDVIESWDHPGTPLGDIRAALAVRPLSITELAARVALPVDTLRTVLRLMVTQGDLVRKRTNQAERFALVPLEDEWDVAA